MEKGPEKLSIIIPVYNEAGSLKQLGSELMQVLGDLNYDFEIIFVDDGSSDASGANLLELEAQFTQIRTVMLRRNFGKSIAYSCGLREVTGDIVVTLDADLQDDPAELPKLLGEYESGADFVVGRKEGRLRNEWWKKIPSVFYNFFANLFFCTNLADANSGFRVIKKEVIPYLDLTGERYRLMPHQAHAYGFLVREVGVSHRKRAFGRSKFGTARFWLGFWDLVAVWYVLYFRQRPLGLFATVALFPGVLGFLLEIYVVLCKLQGELFRTHITAVVTGGFLILIAVQILVLGFIGEQFASKIDPDKYTK